MLSENAGRLVSAKARKIVQEFLSLFSSPDTLMEKLDGCVTRMGRVAEEIVPALAEALDEKEGKKRIGAAWFLINMAGQRPDMLQEAELVERAEKTLVAALENDDRLFALLFLGSGIVPDSADRVLRELLADKDERIQVTAAAAFLAGKFREGKDDLMGHGDAIAILRRTLDRDNEMLVAIASRALIQQSLNKRFAMQELLEAFEKSVAMSKYYILQGLEQAGKSASDAARAVTAAIMDEALPAAVRGQAAETLGKIAADKNAVVGVLRDALSSVDWQVVVGAVNGLIALRIAGERVAGKLAKLLSTDDRNLRWGACLGLKAMGRRALVALPALIERLGDESDLEVCDAMIDAIVAIGGAAIPSLIEVIRQGDARRIRWAGVALVRMGKAAAQHLAEALAEGCDTGTRYAYVMLLRDMGWKAAPAVPALGRILDKTDDEELAFLATAAIFVCGQAGAPAAPSLVRCLMNRSAETASAAERSLKLIGRPAVAALEEALKSAEGTAKRRIEETLTYFRPGDVKRSQRLDRLDRDDLLRLFVLVGTVLEKKGKAGWREIAEGISHQVDFTWSNGKPVGITMVNVRRSVKRLAQKLRIDQLTDNADHQRGGLTREGKMLLSEAREYLRQKYGGGGGLKSQSQPAGGVFAKKTSPGVLKPRHARGRLLSSVSA